MLYAGTLGRPQNLANALEAAAIAREKGVTVSLRFVRARVTKDTIVEFAAQGTIDATFEPRHEVSEPARLNQWEETALVHLTDWEPLNRVVPSKTYEWMAAKLHVSGGVNGEPAELVSRFQAGDVVDPEHPQELAELWATLAQHRDKLVVNSEARQWLENERTNVIPQRPLDIVAQAVSSS